MKRLFFSALLHFYAIIVFSQTSIGDIGRIHIHAYIPEYEEIPYESRKLLQTKLSEIITANGIADNEKAVRFILTARLNILTKDIIAGPPEKISQKINVTFMVGNIDDDKAYEQMTLTLVGVGQSYEKSFMNAFQNINPRNKIITEFISRGKEKIISYYQHHCEEIMLGARLQAEQQNYDEALSLIASIPDICLDCFGEAVQITTDIYHEMIETIGREFFTKAQVIWAESATKEGAQQAANFLSQVPTNSTSYLKATELLEIIIEKMNEIDEREWAKEMQLYHDNKEREEKEWNHRVKMDQLELMLKAKTQASNIKTQRQYIQACRDVAMTYAKNQPRKVTKVVNYNRILLW